MEGMARMTHPTVATAKYYLKELDTLIGYTIHGTAHDEEGFLCLLLGKGEHKKALWFLADEEANNPGTFDIADVKEFVKVENDD